MSVQVGPFGLERLLARGGMGEVWLSHHLGTGAKAAVKLLTGPRAEQAEFLNEFRREVQSTARLDHPNIVRIFDVGTLPEDTSGPGLLPGAPYYVMELGEHGSVEERLSGLRWSTVREILRTLLAALAHAHARGVIHRDIKPGNILLRDEHGGHVLLTDFGIAHAADKVTRTDGADLTSRSVEDATGTPKYMAPEQFMGRWRDYGPWTDLYSVGVLAYQLTTGKTPFVEATFMMYAMAHMNNAFPKLEPRFSVPDGFEAWLSRMVAKTPEQRLQHAADAAWELSKLVDPDDEEPATQEVSVEAESPDTIIEDAVSASWRVADLVGGAHAGDSRPPMPPTWHNVDQESSFRPMPGAGLGLMGIRPTPFSGRENERDVLWETLVRGQTSTQIAVLRGPSGSGKTTLAQWLTYHAAECGAATVMYASHDRTPGARHGLGWLLASHYRAAGLPPEEMLARMRTIFANEAHGDIQARAATEIMRQQCSLPDEEGVSFLQLSSPAARHGFVLKCIAAEARRRPVVVWLDDIHFDLDSLTFVLHAQTKPLGDLPITFVLSVTEEDITPEVQAFLDLLTFNVTKVGLDPLDDQTVCTVLERMGLDEEFAKIVTTRSNGNALFAIQMVQDWVSRGHLRLEDARLVLDDVQAPVPMPQDVEEVWLGQLQSIAATFETTRTLDGLRKRVEFEEDQVWQSLELAAAFGREVDTAEWVEAAKKLGLPDAPEIFDVMGTRGLGALRDKNFTFVNERLRRLLMDSARAADRWKKTNRALARMLTTRYGQDHPGLVLRVARYFVEAEDFAVASMCLDEAYTRAFRTGNQDKITEVLDLQERCLVGAKTPETKATWGHLWLKRSKPLIWQPDPTVRAQGVALMDRAESVARSTRDQTLLAKVLNTRGWLALLSQDYPAAIALFEETLLTAPDHVEKAIAHRFLGQCYLESEDDVNKAREHYELCAKITRDPVDTFSAHQGLFRCAIGERNFDVARGHLSAADALATEHGLMLGAAFVSENRGVLACEEGQWAVAAESYRNAVDLQELLGTAPAYANYNRTQLARCLVLLGMMDQAQAQLNVIAQTQDAPVWDVEAALAVSRGESLPDISEEQRGEMLQSRNPVLIAVVSTLPSV